jgi:hypothetical protein
VTFHAGPYDAWIGSRSRIPESQHDSLCAKSRPIAELQTGKSLIDMDTRCLGADVEEIGLTVCRERLVKQILQILAIEFPGRK